MPRPLQPSTAAPWIWLGLLAALVSLLGGSSRSDVVQIVALRPLAALLLIPALYYLSFAKLGQARLLVSLLALLMLWMALQLMPLPPGLWQDLPDRAVVAELDALAGIEGTWRPIAWDPMRGWNALTSLVIPAAGLLLALAMRAQPRMLLQLIACLGLVDALLGLLQVVGGRAGQLHFYARGNSPLSASGMFANENHSAVFSALVMIVIARLWAEQRTWDQPRWLRLAYAPGLMVVLLATLVSGSRAGLAAGVAALIVAGALLWLGQERVRHRKHGGTVQHWLASHPRILQLLAALAVIALLAAFFMLERSPAFADLFNRNAVEDLRLQLWPILGKMAEAHWLVGIGFGSFEEVYHIYEPTGLLLPVYINQAHHDWAQLVIEGGLPTAILLVVLLGWILLALRGAMRNSARRFVPLVFWLAILAILGAASVVDYPMRTPAFQLVAVWLLLSLALERNGTAGEPQAEEKP